MKKYFGGSYLHKKRKSKRPLDFKKTTHLVLRLKEHLPGLLNPRDKNLRRGFETLAHKYQIQVYHLVFNHSHLHAVLLIPDREAYVGFIRELTSRIVSYFSKTTGIRFGRIFMARPFTRIVNWGRGADQITKYMQKNERESGMSQMKHFLIHEKLDLSQLSFLESI